MSGLIFDAAGECAVGEVLPMGLDNYCFFISKVILQLKGTRTDQCIHFASFVPRDVGKTWPGLSLSTPETLFSITAFQLKWRGSGSCSCYPKKFIQKNLQKKLNDPQVPIYIYVYICIQLLFKTDWKGELLVRRFENTISRKIPSVN